MIATMTMVPIGERSSRWLQRMLVALLPLMLCTACVGGGGGSLGNIYGDDNAGPPPSPSPPEAAANRRFVDPAASGDGDGRSWDHAFTDLTAGLTAIAADPDLDELWVAAGTYCPDEADGIAASFALPAGIQLYGGFAPGQHDPDQRDPDGDPSVLDGAIGGGTPTERVRHVVTGADGALLDGFTLTGGWARLGGWTDMGGGGLLLDGGAMTLRGCTFTGCLAEEDGGGLLAIGAIVVVEACRFIGNQATKGAGLQGVSSTVTLIDCDFDDNVADAASGLGGGAAGYQSDYRLDRCRFDANSGGEHGGGLWIDQGTVFATACWFRGNSARWGGGTSVYQASGAFVSCVFVANQGTAASGYYGAGAYNSNSNTGMSMVACTFLDNRAVGSGGIGGAVTLNTCTDVFSSCVFDGNLGNAGNNAYVTNAELEIGDCLFEGALGNTTWFQRGCACGTSIYTDQGGNHGNVAPDFVDVADPDGADDVMGSADDGLHLLATSAAVAAGDPDAIDALATDDERAAALASDAAGEARTTAGTMSIGAYETAVPSGDG